MKLRYVEHADLTIMQPAFHPLMDFEPNTKISDFFNALAKRTLDSSEY